MTVLKMIDIINVAPHGRGSILELLFAGKFCLWPRSYNADVPVAVFEREVVVQDSKVIQGMCSDDWTRLRGGIGCTVWREAISNHTDKEQRGQ